jgi:hypothetical protein
MIMNEFMIMSGTCTESGIELLPIMVGRRDVAQPGALSSQG